MDNPLLEFVRAWAFLLVPTAVSMLHLTYWLGYKVAEKRMRQIATESARRAFSMGVESGRRSAAEDVAQLQHAANRMWERYPKHLNEEAAGLVYDTLEQVHDVLLQASEETDGDEQESEGPAAGEA